MISIIGMLYNAKVRKDSADQRRVANWFGFTDPRLDVRWRDLRVAITRKPWRLWHRTKHLFVEWTRLSANRAAKVFLDVIIMLSLALAGAFTSLIWWLR